MMKICSVDGCNKPKKSKGLCEMHYCRLRRNGSLYLKNNHAKKIEIEIKENSCIECTSHQKLSTGYYLYMVNYNRKSLHRHVYEEMFGEIPEGLVVRHKCDNRGCINPEHLELGTHLDNSQDMVKRNRSLKGSKHHNAKLDEPQVKEIKKLMKSKVQNKDLAIMFNVDRDTISNIKNGRTWKHVL